MTQPVDIGIGRPLKLRIRELWHEFVMERGTDTAIFRTPDRETVTKWVTDAHTTITADIIKNAWQKTVLSCFENE